MWILTDAYELGYEYTCSISHLGIVTSMKGFVPKDCADCPCKVRCKNREADV